MKRKSAIMQIMYGEREMGSLPFRSEEYDKAMDNVAECSDKLIELLSPTPEILLLYKKFCDNLDSAHADEVESYYEEGFNLGLLLGVEAGKS